MCRSCAHLQAGLAIRTPGELAEAIRVAQASVTEGVLRPIESMGAVPIAALQSEGSWPDLVEYLFCCAACGCEFELSVETYHGSGGFLRRRPDPRVPVKPPFATPVVAGAAYVCSVSVVVVLRIGEMVVGSKFLSSDGKVLWIAAVVCATAVVVLNVWRPIRLTWLVPRAMGQLLVTLCSPPAFVFALAIMAPHGMRGLSRMAPPMLGLALGSLTGVLILALGPWRRLK